MLTMCCTRPRFLASGCAKVDRTTRFFQRLQYRRFLNMILSCAGDAGARKALSMRAASSTYGDSDSGIAPKVEDRIGHPLSPYSAVNPPNMLTSFYADVFDRRYGFPSIGLRYFNVFGQRQDPTARMPPSFP